MKAKEKFWVLILILYPIITSFLFKLDTNQDIAELKSAACFVVEYTIIQPDPACSVQTTTVGGEEVTRGSLEVDGVVEDGDYYPYADVEALPPEDHFPDVTNMVECWITHYGPPGFPIHGSNATASGYEIYEILGDDTHDSLIDKWSAEWGVEVDGFCAVSEGTPWFWDICNDPPILLHIEGHGNYIPYDHKGERDCEGCDIYEPGQASFPGENHYGYCDPAQRVWRVR